MTLLSRRVLLGALALLGLFVGTWAALFPASFFTDFPGLGLGAWVAEGGPYDEHLVRDVGELNLALAAIAIAASCARTAATGTVAGRVAAVGWLVYSVPHLAFHLAHLGGLPMVDSIGEPVALSLSIVLSVPLLFPVRRARGTLEKKESS